MRYLPLTDSDRQEMLSTIGTASIDDLFDDVPKAVRLDGLIDLPLHAGELEVERDLAAMAQRNIAAGSVPNFLGAGAYRHHVPAVVDHLIQRSEFLTSYTPYQPEVSQGTLQYLFEFQTQVATITGMDTANASMYDGATSCAEAVLMACRVTKRNGAILSGGLHPHYSDVTQTMTRFGDFDVQVQEPDVEGTETLGDLVGDTIACVVVQYPTCFGHITDLQTVADACHKAGALLVVAVTEVVALGALTPPGDLGADIVVAEGQSLGNGLNFGGPYLGLFATREKYVRQMPGRLCGETTDADGRRGYVLTLSTREQHIRREKATSNICTNSGLCALAFCIHLSLLGGEGFVKLAELNHANAVVLADRLAEIPQVEVVNKTFFNEFTVRLPGPAGQIISALAAKNILGGVPASRLFPGSPSLDNLLFVAATECLDEASSDAFVAALAGELQ